MIERSVPRTAPDRAGWAGDMYAAFTMLRIDQWYARRVDQRFKRCLDQ